MVEKVIDLSDTLGGISRLSFQMSVSALPHAQALHAIEILGSDVAPAVRKLSGEIATGSGADTQKPQLSLS